MRIGLQAMNIFLEGSKHAGVSRTSLCLLEALLEINEHEYVVFIRPDFECPSHWTAMRHVKIVRTWSKTRSWAILGRELAPLSHHLDAWFSVSGPVPKLPMKVKGSLVHDIFYRTYASTFTDQDRRIHEKMSQNIARYSSFIACNSVATANEFSAAYGVERYKFVPLPFGIGQVSSGSAVTDTKVRRSELGVSSNKYIFSISTLEPRKNFPRLLEAFNQVAWLDCFNGVNLVIAGGKGWNEGETLDAVHKFNLEDRVQFLGYIADADVPVLFSGAEFAVSASLDEGFGVPLLEAMHYGCPLVSSDRPAMREVGGNLPIYFEPTSVDSIANALITGINRTNHEELVSLGFERSKLFSWQKSADLLLKHMSKLANE